LTCVHSESNLDLEYAMGLVHPLDVTLYQVGDAIVGGSFNTLYVPGFRCLHRFLLTILDVLQFGRPRRFVLLWR
jgi:hypothetical protein